MSEQVKVARIRIKWHEDTDDRIEGSYAINPGKAVQVYVNRRDGTLIDTAYTNDGLEDHEAQIMEAALLDEEKPEPAIMPVAHGLSKSRDRNTCGFFVSDSFQHGLGEAFEVSDATWEATPFAKYGIEPDTERRERHYWMNAFYACQEYERAEGLNNGEWGYLGCQAIAETEDDEVYAESGGLWGIESDSDAGTKQEIVDEQLAELHSILSENGANVAPDVEVINEGA